MLECFKSKSGKDVYYFEGKRISKREAQSLRKRLPSCSRKTSKNEIKSLKKRVKEIMSGRETYKTESKDLQQRLNACDIIKNKYTDLIALIESASDKVDVMNRVCLTQDVKRKMDEEYTKIEKSLQETSLKNNNLEGVIDDNKKVISDLTNTISEIKQTNSNLESLLNEEKRERNGVQKSLEELTDLCSDRPELLNTIEDLKVRVYNLESINNDVQNELENNIKSANTLRESLNKTKGYLTDCHRSNKDIRNEIIKLENKIESYDVAIDRYEKEVKTLEIENKELRDSIVGNENLQTILDQLRNELTQKAEDEEELRRQLLSCDKKYEDVIEKDDKYIKELEIANKSLENRIESMADLAKKLNESYKQEKERCILEVQKAIDGEREISKKEAKEFESKIADLNAKLLITEETLEELKGVGKLEDLSQIPQVKGSLKKVSKKLKKLNRK